MRYPKICVLMLSWFVFFSVLIPAHAAELVGESIAVSGDVSILQADTGQWMKVETGHLLYAGDTLQTGPASKVSVLCVDESQIKLSENTLMVFKSAVQSARLGYQPVATSAGSFLDIDRGRAWIRNSKETFRFELTTPAVTAAIRGTEFTVEVKDNGRSTIALVQGRLSVFNNYGILDLAAGEMAVTNPGQAPQKQILLHPEDAVQWVLYYPGLSILQTLSLAELNPSDPAGPAMKAYDRGDFQAARELSRAQSTLSGTTQALVVQGFLALRDGQDQHASDFFEKALKILNEPRAMAGRALAVYRLEAPDQAYALFDAVMRQVRSADVFALGGFFALMVDKPEQAAALFRQGLALAPHHVGCQTMLTQMALVANRKGEAQIYAESALLSSPDSPLTLMNAGLVDIAFFDLKRAEERMQKAASQDPGFLEPLLYLARLQLGAERLDDASMTLDKARSIAPQSASVHNLDGFTHLAFRRFAAAEKSFQRAVQADPALGDPHLGLGLCAYARGDEINGLHEILTATLLDPKVSQFHSMLGKAFYQSRAFDKALDAFDYASRLDPNDPTPHLYKGIALTDLNRPAEAIREINTSISKNNNRAVFRSSLMLDRDLAVRNADLAKPYAALGLGEWSFSKALTAVKADPLNPSAHLFLSSVFASTRQRTSASGSELLMYRLLSPANQNTFTGIDYTPMFESPYMRMVTTGSAGAWSNDNRIVAGGAEVYGGFPGFAADVFGSVTRDEGMRTKNSLSQPTMLSGLVKWEPSTSDAFFGAATLYDTKAEDNRNLSDATYANALNLEQDLRTRLGELGYVRRFSPEAALLVYAKQGFNAWDYGDETFDPAYLTGDGWSLSETRQQKRQTSMPYTNLQAQQQFIWNDHTFMVGVDSFRGKFHYDFHELDTYWLSWPAGSYEGIWDEFTFTNRYALTQDSLSLYMLDYWKPSENVVIEAGLSADRSSSVRHGYSDPVDRHFTGSRLGVNWQMTSQDVLRLAFQNYLNTHMTYQNTLQPADVAGFPSWINADDGTEVLEAGLAWERQWNELTYSVFRFNAHEIKNPQYDATSADNEIKDVLIRRYQAQATLNRILSPSWGGWTTISAKRLLPNEFALSFSPNTDFAEADLAFGLSYLHEKGFGAHAEGFLIHQHFCDKDARDLGGDTLDDEAFSVFNVGCSYIFPDKRGRIGLEVKNLFDQRFAYQLEMVALDSIYPARQAVLSVSLYF